MTSLERLNARLAGKPVDKLPNMNIFMSIIAREAGVSYREYASDYRKLVDGYMVCLEKYGLDHVSVISDPMREASAYGIKVEMPEDGVPYAKEALVTDDMDLSVLKLVDPADSPRTLDRIKGCELLRQKVGGDYPVIGWVEGCIAEAADLRGLNELLLDLAGGEEYLPEFFDTLLGQQKLFAKAQIDAGADIIGIGNAAASLIGPALYKRYGFAWDKALIDHVHECGARVKLHICGNITSILEQIRDLNADIVDVDWMVDFARAVDVFKGSKTTACGNINPVALMQEPVEKVKDLLRACLGTAAPNTLIAAGCEVPAASPDENLLAMDKLLWGALVCNVGCFCVCNVKQALRRQ
jgi:uroporphyrinogen decarboxylase